MEPLISIRLDQPHRHYLPGQRLRADYQVDAPSAQELLAVEASVLWHTEGKGEEELGVHYFQRHVPGGAEDDELRRQYTLEVELPNSPLTYEGMIVKIFWGVRIRVFARGLPETVREVMFRLGNLPAAVSAQECGA